MERENGHPCNCQLCNPGVYGVGGSGEYEPLAVEPTLIGEVKKTKEEPSVRPAFGSNGSLPAPATS